MVFLLRSDQQIVEAFLEVPLLFFHEFKLLNIVQSDYNIRLLRKLLWGFVADEDTFNRVQVQVARIVRHAQTMHLPHLPFQSNQREERNVRKRGVYRVE